MTLKLAGFVIGFLALAGSSALCGDAAVAEPDGYRTQDYRALTPNTLKGARIVTTSEAAAIWSAGQAAFVDVLPQPPRPAGLPPGTIWCHKPRLTI